MLSEFECQACKTRFVVASTQNAAQLPTVFCVYCGHRSLRYIGSRDDGSNEDIRRIKVTQNDIRDVFGIGQNVLVRCGKDWFTQKILDITVLRHDTFCPHCGIPLLGEPRFWFKGCGNVGLEDVMAVEDIDPKLKKSATLGLVTTKEVELKPE